MKRFRERMAEKLELPKDVVMDLPRVSICGDKEVFVENHKGVTEYTDKCIRIKMNDGMIGICGDDMRIIVLEKDRMIINGDFERLEYEKFGRKVKNVQKNL
ncbi:MAG: sporulation protein YqfC [Clostridia bacterium]|nr:sporulation protein YqfC [Clostridia bacterium]